MLRKMICLVVLVLFLFVSVTPAYAAETEVRSVYDLEEYMNLSSVGLIEFDAEQALADGFPNDMVARHQERISFMNSLVLEGVTTINEGYTAVVYFGGARSTYNLDSTYVEYNPWGYTLYLSRADTTAVVNALPSDQTIVQLADLISNINGAAGIITTGIILQTYTIRNAAANGRGIYIQVYDDGTTAVPVCIVGPR